MSEQTPEARLNILLSETSVSLACAESCTGGLIASRVIDIAGSSAYMLGGVVSYSNAAKQNILNVRHGTLIAYGAVSEPVAEEMATGVKNLFNADYAISVTGIAGPGGGTAEKPVGLTYIGLALPDGTVRVQRHLWQGSRIEVKQQSADAALNWLIEVIQHELGG
ncbi:MAG: CinA family protein [Chloroflexota bacterium]